jgi:tetratricopeptide (TPR) repeat protein
MKGLKPLSEGDYQSPPPIDLLNRPARWMCALIFGTTLLAYFPAFQGGYIWDDAGHVTRTDLQSLHGLGRIWCEIGATQQYYPALHTAFWVEHHLWGDSPLGYHLINVLLHATAACLLGIILRRLAIPGAWLAALLFALHPVCVESVAWIAEQKNTLSAVLYFSAALAYLRFDEKRKGAPYALATGLFAIALLTKTVTATLPAALLVIFWWKRGRLAWRDFVPLAPWFALASAAGWVTAWFERTRIGAQGADFSLTLVQRGLLAGRVIWFYVGKLVWPADLIFIYPRWTVDSAQAWQWLFPLAALALLAGLWLGRQRGALAGVLFFFGTLFPALGFINVFPFLFSYVADHFQYLACVGLLAMGAAGLTAFLTRFSPRVGRLLCTLMMVGLGTLTWRQSAKYRDAVTLYESTLAENPACWLAHNNLAMLLANAGRTPEAIPHLEQALHLRPDFPEAENNLGDDLRQLGRPREAIPHFERALRLQPDFAEAHCNLGVALMMTGQTANGITEFKEALRLRADFPLARFNLGLALADNGQTAEAIGDFAEAVRLKPDFGQAEFNWGIGLALTGRFPEARAHFERALQLEPDSPGAHYSFARALAGAGRLDEAIAHYEKAVLLAPDLADAHLNLALALRQAGRMSEAELHDQEARRLNAGGAPGGN